MDTPLFSSVVDLDDGSFDIWALSLAISVFLSLFNIHVVCRTPITYVLLF